MKRLFATVATSAFALCLSQNIAQAQQVEVLHYWTAGGEAAAAKSLQSQFEAEGGTWVDAPVAGGGGETQATVLRTRVLAGNPPAAVQLKGPNITAWAEQGALADLTDVATAENWDALLPPLLQEVTKYKDHYVAVPVNIHRTNWMWINPKLLAQVGADVPQSWDEFNETADKLLAAGITPLAHGGQDWQDATIFESVVLGLGGPDFYQKVFVELDEEALKSEQMIKVFDQMRKIRGYVDPNFSGRDWNLATSMIIQGDAAIQIMGDWAKGEFTVAGKQPQTDYLCAPTPGGFILNSDSFAMFKMTEADKIAGQNLLAKLILDEAFQIEFNQNKGSIPARLGIDPANFDACAQASMADLETSIEAGTLVPSMAHEIAQAGAVRGAFLDIITQHFNTDMSSQEAVELLVEEIDLAK